MPASMANKAAAVHRRRWLVTSYIRIYRLEYTYIITPFSLHHDYYFKFMLTCGTYYAGVYNNPNALLHVRITQVFFSTTFLNVC